VGKDNSLVFEPPEPPVFLSVNFADENVSSGIFRSAFPE
jgi:hypothetical protein